MRMKNSGFFFGPKRISYKYDLEPVDGKAQYARREQQGGRVEYRCRALNSNEQGT